MRMLRTVVWLSVRIDVITTFVDVRSVEVA